MAGRATLLLGLLLSLLLHRTAANLMGVDLGLGYIKVAVARPGKGLELVTNEQAKRKTPAAVGFTDEGERLFGDAAVAYAAKAPTRAILDGRSLIGECADAQSSPLCERKTLTLADGAVGPFTGEEVIAMLLAMARRQASAFLGGAVVKDVAVTVPAWYDERQRQAVADAARVIGLNCLGVVNANTAAAIKYALDGKARPTEDVIAAEKAKDKKKRSPKTVMQRVLFYDIGAGSASASIAEVTSDVKTGLATAVKMLVHTWEKGIGGRVLDSVVVDRLADAFDKQRGAGATPTRELPRAMMRLRKEAQRVREVLSANTDTMVSVPSLHDDLDLRTTLNRADFEKDAKSMLSLVGGPVRSALSEAKLSAKDLDAVVPFGGASRTPRVQEELRNVLGVESLNKSINTDEAAVMGSVFFAASMSSTFRVRKLEFEDVYTRSITAEIEKESSSGGLFSGTGKAAVQKVEIFSDGVAKMPSKKTLSLNRNKDFDLTMYLGLDSTGKYRFPERTLYSKIQVKGVADVLKKLKDPSKAKNLTPRVALTFHVDRSGLIRIGTAESSVDETVVVEREVEIKEEKTNKTKEGNGKGEKEKSESDDSDTSSDTEKKDTKEAGDDAKDKRADESELPSSDTKDNAENSDKKEKKKTKIEKSTQTIVHRQSLTIKYDDKEGIMGMQMSGKELEAAKKVLKDLEAADIERVERADALNALEGFILEIRSKVRGVDEEDDIYKVSTEEDREKLVEAFDRGEDWMYTDEARQTANLRKKHFELQKLYEPMETRAKEMAIRPGAFKNLQAGLNLALEKMGELRKLHIERNSKKVGEFDKFTEFCQSAKTWISEQQQAQDKKPPTENPAVTVKDIIAKGMELKKQVEKIINLELPPAPKPSPETTDKKTNTSEGSDDSANSTSTEAPPVDEEVINKVPNEPGAESVKADAASGATTKDEL